MLQKQDYLDFMHELYVLERAMIDEALAIKKLVSNQQALALIDVWIADEWRHTKIVEDLKALINNHYDQAS